MAPQQVPVSIDNFVRAEPDMYFGIQVKQGAFGKFHHIREPMPIDNQIVVRANRDVLVSTEVFDLDSVWTVQPSGGTFRHSHRIDKERRLRCQIH